MYRQQYDVPGIISSYLDPYDDSRFRLYTNMKKPMLNSSHPYQYQYQSLVMLFVLEMDDNRNTFSYLNITTIPRIYVVPPSKWDNSTGTGTGGSGSGVSVEDIPMSALELYRGRAISTALDDLVQEISAATGIQVCMRDNVLCIHSYYCECICR